MVVLHLHVSAQNIINSNSNMLSKNKTLNFVVTFICEIIEKIITGLLFLGKGKETDKTALCYQEQLHRAQQTVTDISEVVPFKIFIAHKNSFMCCQEYIKSSLC